MSIMKWIIRISLTVVMLALNISAYAEDWKAAEHDYHVGKCSRIKERAQKTDTLDCQNYSGRTAYSCCCDVCDDYSRECLKNKLSSETCAKIKTNCQHDCNGFLSSQSPKNK